MAGKGTMRQLAKGLAGLGTVRPRPEAIVPEMIKKTRTVRTMLDEIKASHGDNFVVTPEQIDQLVDATYTTGRKILSLSDRPTIFDVIGMLMRSEKNPDLQFDVVLTYITSKANSTELLWDQDGLQEARDKLLVTSELLQKKERGIKGVGECGRCHSDELVFAEKQLRSADEPMTIFVRCIMCGNRWTM